MWTIKKSTNKTLMILVKKSAQMNSVVMKRNIVIDVTEALKKIQTKHEESERPRSKNMVIKNQSNISCEV